MAIEKMALAFCKGKTQQLDKMIMDCCVDGQFHVEDAGKFISESMGFKPFNEENTYKPLLNHMRDMASIAGVDLDEEAVSDVDLQNNDMQEMIVELEEKVSSFLKQKNDLNEQRQKCLDGIAIYRNFTGLDVSIDRIRECEFIKARFGRLPKESYMKLNLSREREAKKQTAAAKQASAQKQSKEVGRDFYKVVDHFIDLDPDTIDENDSSGVKFGSFKKDDYEKFKELSKQNETSFSFIECEKDSQRQWGVYITPNDERAVNDVFFAKSGFEKADVLKEGLSDRQALREFKIALKNARKASEKNSKGNSDLTKNAYFMFLPCGEDESSVWGVYFSPVEKIKETDRTFASLHFELIETPGAAGRPSEIVANLEKDIEIIDSEIEALHKKVAQYWEDNEEKCNILYSVTSANDKVFEMKKHAVINDDYFFLVGWVVNKNKRAFSKAIENISDVEVEFSTPEENPGLKPPTKLKNLKIAKPFEFFIDMYGLPGYNEVDVTSFVAVTYTLMFGIMFGDLGQGLILTLAGALMWKLKKMALGKALIPCGFSAMLFGLIYGSVFGYEDLLDPLYKAVGLRGKPLPVLESVNTILIYAISIGIILVTCSILINIYACLKRRARGEAIFSQNGLAGLLFYLSAVSLAVEFMSKRAFIPTQITKWTLIVCAIILLFKEMLIGLFERRPDWKPESFGDFLMQNLFELLEYVLSYASNTVSFLRVGAFVLVHAGMMMVVFNLAGESRNIFVIILGNVLVIALEGLLTGIQAMRLEFYEMFSRFYEGDGRPFNSVKIKKIK